jgi:hypothetical protein
MWMVWRRRSAWAALGLMCLLLAIGVIPQLWEMPLLREVQFPFRLLPVAEFALATAMANLQWRSQGLALRLIPLFAISAFTIAAPPVDQGVTVHDVRVSYADVPENLPPGDRPYSWPSRWALDVAASHPLAQFQGGVTTEPVFYFPAWRVQCAGGDARTFPAPHTQLLSYRGQNCSRDLALTMPERAGAVLSLVALLVILAASWFRRGPAGRLVRQTTQNALRVEARAGIEPACKDLQSSA